MASENMMKPTETGYHLGDDNKAWAFEENGKILHHGLYEYRSNNIIELLLLLQH